MNTTIKTIAACAVAWSVLLEVIPAGPAAHQH
jgi:hypothetical protein